MKGRIFTSLLCILSIFNLGNAQDAEILNETTHATVNSKNQLTVIYSFSIQINNRRGEDLTNFKVNSSKRINVKDIQGSITTVNGVLLNKLNKKEIKKVSSFSDISFYQDEFTEYFTLRHNTYPYVIHCTFTKEFDEFMHIVEWTPMYNRNYPTKKAELTITVPADYKIKIKERNIQYQKTIDDKGNNIYKWESDYTNILKEEIYCADITELLPMVYIVPAYFTYGVPGSFDSWQSFGLWYNNLISGLNDLPASEIAKFIELTKNIGSNKEKARILYNYMQDNTRFIDVTLGIGGLKPFPASYVAYNKYGDCKALTNYMKAMLEIVGIKSYFSIINAGEKIAPFYSDFPSSQFNHVFLMVPFEKDTVWLECTNQNIPFGYLGTFTQNRNSLVIYNENGQLEQTPPLKDIDVLKQMNSMIDINLIGKSKAKINYICKGSSYEYIKWLSKKKTPLEQEDKIRSYIDFSNFDLISWSFENQQRDSASITLNTEIESAEFCKKYDSDYVLNIIPLDLPKFESPRVRKLPLVFDYPIWKKYSVTFNLPESARISHMPTDTLLTNVFGRYEINYFKSDTSITVNYVLQINRGHYPLEKYPAFFEFVKSILSIERKNHPILTL